MHIRKAVIDDLSEIMGIYRAAQEYMIASGNPNQWGHFYPTEELIKEDIAKKTSYVIVGENAGSKERKAKDLGIPILSEDDFLAMIE